jgi:bacterioferritin
MQAELKPRKRFAAEVAEIGRRTRHHIDEAVRAEGEDGKEIVLKILNDALATQVLNVHRYRQHYDRAAGNKSATIAEEFLKHAIREQHHVYRIAERIVQLGGVPDFRRDRPEYLERQELIDMIREDLIAQRIAIESYAEILRYLSDGDTESRRLIEDIVALEAKHSVKLNRLIDNLSEGVPTDSSRAS